MTNQSARRPDPRSPEELAATAADEAPGIAQETPLDRAIREAQREAERLTPQERRDRDWAALCLAIWSH